MTPPPRSQNPESWSNWQTSHGPSVMFTFIDKEEASMTHGTFVLDAGQTENWYTLPGERDRRCGANVALRGRPR